MEDKVSVIIPIYKVEKYLCRCIDSVLNQSFSNMEIILVDDGSPDNCGEICDEYRKKDSRVIVIHQENKGLSEARNAGINVATGEYLSFIDSDDYIEKDMIKILYEDCKVYDADISCCSHKDIYEDTGNVVDNSTSEVWVLDTEEALASFLYTKRVDVVAWNKLYKAELFKEVRYEKGKLFEDHFTTYKLLSRANVIVHNDVALYNYCKRKTSIGGSNFSMRNFELKEALDIECEYIKERFPKITKDVNLGYLLWLFVIYDKAILSDYSAKQFLKEIRRNIRESLLYILYTNKITMTKKMQMLVLLVNKRLYYNLYVWYIKKYR